MSLKKTLWTSLKKGNQGLIEESFLTIFEFENPLKRKQQIKKVVIQRTSLNALMTANLKKTTDQDGN